MNNTTTTKNTLTEEQRNKLAALGVSKAVEELHSALHEQFRMEWRLGINEEQADTWINALTSLPDAEGNFHQVGLRQCRANGWDDSLASRHPAQAAVLATIPIEDRGMVVASAHLQQNLCGGPLSVNLSAAATEYRRIGAVAMARKDRLTNARMMGWTVDEDGHRIDR